MAGEVAYEASSRLRIVSDDEDVRDGDRGGRGSGSDAKIAILRVRMKPQTLQRIRDVAEYERMKHGELGRGRCMSTLVLGWILDNLDAIEDEMLLAAERAAREAALRAAEEAAIAAAPRDFTGKPPKATGKRGR